MVLAVYRPWWTSTRIPIYRPHSTKQTLFNRRDTTAILPLYRTVMAGLWTDQGLCGAKDHCNTFNEMGYPSYFTRSLVISRQLQLSPQVHFWQPRVRYFAQRRCESHYFCFKITVHKIYLLLLEGLAVLPRGIFIYFKWVIFSLIWVTMTRKGHFSLLFINGTFQLTNLHIYTTYCVWTFLRMSTEVIKLFHISGFLGTYLIQHSKIRQITI